MNDLRVQFGDIDIYLFDQLLRGRIAPACTSSMPAAAAVATWSTSSEADTTSPPPTRLSGRGATRPRTRGPAQSGAPGRQLPRRANRGDELHAGVGGHRHCQRGPPFRVEDPNTSTRCCAASGPSSPPADCCSHASPPPSASSALVEPLGDGRFRLPDGSDCFLVDEKDMLTEATRRLAPTPPTRSRRRWCSSNGR